MSNICKCPNPPGGEVVCEQHQLAVCRVRDGEVISQCLNPPSALSIASDEETNRLQLANWVLAVVTNEPREDLETLGEIDTEILRRGSFHDARTGEKVSFTFPGLAASAERKVEKVLVG